MYGWDSSEIRGMRAAEASYDNLGLLLWLADFEIAEAMAM